MVTGKYASGTFPGGMPVHMPSTLHRDPRLVLNFSSPMIRFWWRSRCSTYNFREVRKLASFTIVRYFWSEMRLFYKLVSSVGAIVRLILSAVSPPILKVAPIEFLCPDQ